MHRKSIALAFATALGLFAAGRGLISYATVKPILDAQRDALPPELRNAGEGKWDAWARRRDKAIRARLDQGDLDSMVNLLLMGTSFTAQPRIRMERLTEASKSGTLRARVDDLVAGLRTPGNNERLVVLQQLLRRQGVDIESPQAGVFIYKNLLRVMQERRELARREAEKPVSGLDRSSIFQDRGLSLDTSIFPEFLIEQTLRDLKERGVLRQGQVARAAVIGPGLDFIDKDEDSAYDYYPPQTLQPFALYDSLLRLGLAKPDGLSLAILDISPRVLEHIRLARERAATHAGYVLQLPRDVGRPWPADLIAYWRSLGDHTGEAADPIRPPEMLAGLETRAVRIRPEVVLSCRPLDLDIILQRIEPTEAGRFDLIVATNIFVYYDAFEQALALENAGAMLNPGGLLLTNDRLPESAAGSMRLEGITVVPFDSPGVSARQAVGWYGKKESGRTSQEGRGRARVVPGSRPPNPGSHQ